jgi:hypothetical protein
MPPQSLTELIDAITLDAYGTDEELTNYHDIRSSSLLPAAVAS